MCCTRPHPKDESSDGGVGSPKLGDTPFLPDRQMETRGHALFAQLGKKGVSPSFPVFRGQKGVPNFMLRGPQSTMMSRGGCGIPVAWWR